MAGCTTVNCVLGTYLPCNENNYAVLQVDSLWELLCPLLRTALSNITIETYADWGTCIATACVSLPLFTSIIAVSFLLLILCCGSFMNLLFLPSTGEPRPTQIVLAV